MEKASENEMINFTQSTNRPSIEQYNQEINEAESEYQKGDYIKHEELLKQIKKW